MMMSLALAAQLLEQGGVPCTVCGVTDPAAVALERVHSDSRTLQAGDLFVALVGERFDAHDFLVQARDAGSAAALVQTGRAIKGLPCLEVADTRVALQALARQWRSLFEIPVIAVTGSNGKTTVTQMLAAILRAAYDDACLATQGNFNNEIGLPLMVLRLRSTHRAAVFELGMNHSGEIALLAGIAQPTVALVNNAQREHQEFMHSVQAVAEENGAAISALPVDGVAVFPADDAYSALWQSLAGARTVHTFGVAQGCTRILQAQWHIDMHAGWALDLCVDGVPAPVTLAALGQHNLCNAVAAAAAASAAGVPHEAIVQGLNAFRPVKGRGVLHAVVYADGTRQWLVDDCYNANPDSVLAAIDVLAALPSPRLLVLGDMGEVGERGEQFHAEIGAYAKSRGIDGLWSLGRLAGHAAAAFGNAARHFQDMATLSQALAVQTPALASLLVKGSRFMAMERAFEHALHAAQQAGGRVQP